MSKDADVDRLTFSEWFKREYPLYEREGVSRDTSLKAALRIAWETAERQSLSHEAVRDEVLALALAAVSDCDGLVPEHWWLRKHAEIIKIAHDAALKREPNAAVPEEVIEIDEDGKVHPARCQHCGKELPLPARRAAGPAPAAPVAEMVRQLDVAIEADDQEAAKNTGFTEELDDALRALDLRGMRTALLARLGQGWVPQGIPLEKDAARYRWLRECSVTRSDRTIYVMHNLYANGLFLRSDYPSHDRLDAAIDAALKARA